MSTVNRHTSRRVARIPAVARPSALLTRMMVSINRWLRGWWQRWVDAVLRWHKRPGEVLPQVRQPLTCEPLEPRILLSSEFHPGIQAILVTSSSAQALDVSAPATINLTPLVDADGTQVTLGITGPGTAQLVSDGAGFALKLNNTDASTQVALAANGGDGRIVLTGISVSDDVGALDLAVADLQGDATFSGTLRTLVLGDLRNARLDLAGATDITLQAGKIVDSQLHAPLARVSVVASDWLAGIPGASRLELAGLSSLSTSGDFAADLHVSGQGVPVYALGSVRVGGAIVGGMWSIHGRGSVLQAGSTSRDWCANFTGTLVQFISKGDASGSLSLAALQMLQVGGSARGFTLLVGADLGDDCAPGGVGANADSYQAGTLARVRITGNLVDSRLLVGLDPVNAVFGDGNDQQLGSPTQRLQEFIVGGQVTDSTVVAPAFPSAVRIGGTSLAPATLSQVFASVSADSVAPVLSARLQDDTGSVSDDGLTRDPAVLVEIIEAGVLSAIEASLDDSAGFLPVSAALQGDGSYLINARALAELRGGSLPDGAYTLSLRARDAAGNVAEPVTVRFTLDTSAPALGQLALDPSSDSGALGDLRTTAEIVTLIGRSTAGAAIELAALGLSTTADETGAFSFTNLTLALGSNRFDFTASDAAGNRITASLEVERTEVISDTTAPTLSAALANDSGTSNSDRVTNDPAINGQTGDDIAVTQLLVAVDPGATPDSTDLSGLIQPDGSFTLSAAQLASLAGGVLADGEHSVLIQALDAAGNVTEKTVSFTLDTSAPALGQLALDPATDTGALGDLSTTAEIVTLIGQSTSGAVIQLAALGRSTTADASGAFSFADVALALGSNRFDFTASDAAGNRSTASLEVERTEVISDTTAPTLSAALANDTGTSNGDRVTNDPAINGQTDDDVGVTQLLVTVDPTGTPDTTDLSGLIQADGSFTLSAAQLASLAGGVLADGEHSVLIQALDAAGNVTEKTVSFTLDTSAPALGQLALDPPSDTGALGDLSTTVEIVTLIGQSAAGAAIELAFLGLSTTADESGAFSFSNVALALGSNRFDFTASDAAGNRSTASLEVERTEAISDTTAPTLSAALANDTGTSNSDRVTNDPAINGQTADDIAVTQLLVAVDPGATPDSTDLSGLIQPDGSYTLSAAQLASLAGGALADGEHTVLIQALDAAGNVTEKTVSFTLDTSAPALGQLALDPATDTGTLGDLRTTAEIVTLVGQSAAGAAIELAFLGLSTTADETGAFSFSNVALALGSNRFDFTASDAAGNRSTASLEVERTEVIGDTTAPTLSAILARDTGTSNSDRVTNDPTIIGQTGDNVAVTQLLVAIDPTGTPDTIDLSGLIQPDGRFTLSAAQLASLAGGVLADGEHSVLIQALDAAGNVTEKTVSFTLDTAAPAAATFAIATADAFNGDDSQTSASRVVLRGQAPAGAIVTLGAQGLSTLAGQTGSFQLANVGLVEGENLLSLTIADAAGNTLSVARTLTRVTATHSDAVLDWNAIALEAIKRDVTDPPVATRVLAIQSLAVFDTLAAIEGTPAYLVQRTVSGPISITAAVAQAAHRVLSQLYPAQRASFDAALQSSLAGVPDGAARTAGIALGQEIADAVLAIRAADGYRNFITDDGSTAIGKWRPTGPAFLTAEDPQWSYLVPFALTSGDEFRAPPPPALDSLAYAQALEEVRSLGSATSATRSADQTEQALFWADGGGSLTPPGHWSQIASQVAREQGNSLSANARLLAQINVALADAAIACWDTKYAYDFWRPETAIHNAGADGNAGTTQDASWRPLLISPAHPDYVSGHSTFSAAAAEVLAATFGDAVSFTTTSSTLPGVTRSYGSFSQAAAEAGASRVYGGIHTSFADLAGRELGKQVAVATLARFALNQDTQAPTIVASKTPAATNSNLTLSGQILDNLSGVAGAQWRLDNGELQELVVAANGSFSISTAFVLDGSADGVHTLTVLARDVAGNLSSAYTRSFILDTQAPTLSLSSLQEGASLTGNSRLTGIADAAGSALTLLSYRLGSGPLRSLIFDSDGGFDAALAFAGLDIGSHTLVLNASDAAGNSASLTRIVKVDALAAFTVVSVTPASGAQDVGVTFRPQVNFSRAVNTATLTADSLYATAPDGSKIAATIVPALDGSFAWLFFTKPLPGASQIKLHVNGSAIRAQQDGAFLDADGNGSSGGLLTSELSAPSAAPRWPGRGLSARWSTPVLTCSR
jgi:hypothetical protein